MRKPRKRINLSVSEGMYERVAVISSSHGFRTVCEFAVALLRIASARIEAAESAGTEPEAATDTSAEIEEMFNELAEHEARRYGIVPVRRHTPQRYGKG